MRKARSGDETVRRTVVAAAAGAMVAVLGLRPYPDWVGDRLRQATDAAAGGYPQASLEALSRALEFEPALASLHAEAGRLALQAGDPQRAADHVAQARAAGVDDSRLTCLDLESQLAQGSRLSSIGSSSVDCVLSSPHPSAWPEAALADSDLETAQRMLALMVEGHAATLKSWERLAGLTEILQPESAPIVVRRALAFEPRGSPLLDRLFALSQESPDGGDPAERAVVVGREFAAEPDWPMAIAVWRWAVNRGPDYPRAQAYLGSALDQTGGDGYPHMLRAAAESPGDPVVRALLGRYWLRHGRPDQALRELALARDLAPADPAIAASLGEALASLGRYPEAAEAYFAAASVDASDPAFWLALSEFCLQHDFLVADLGLPAARNAAALVPSPPALAALGFAHSLAGRPLVGLRLQVHAAALDPLVPVTWYRLGLTQLELGSLVDARRSLAQAVHLDPQGAIGLLASRTLETLSP